MRVVSEGSPRTSSAQTSHAAELHFLFRPLISLAAIMEDEPRESRLERLGESLARAAMHARESLARLRDDPANPVQIRDYRRASALLTGIATAGLLAGQFRFAFKNCAPGGYSSALAPGPREALSDLMSLCDWAEELWPAPRWV